MNNQNSGFSKFLGSAILAGAVAILGLAWAIYTFYGNNRDTQKALENQAIQIAQQQTQIALIAQQNQFQSQQLTLAVEQSNIEGQLLTPISPDNGNSSLTATALSIEAFRVEATSQAIATKQKGIEATQTAVASSNITFKVFADKEWQDTGVTVQNGQLLQINYLEGEWSQCASYGCPYFSADGEAFETPEDNVVVGCNDSELVGRILGGESFCVGALFAGKAPNSGKLELRINDAVVSDNGGSVTVLINIHK